MTCSLCLLPFSSARGKVVESYCYQVFLDQKHSLVLPTVQQLLEHSLHSEGLTMAEVNATGLMFNWCCGSQKYFVVQTCKYVSSFFLFFDV